FAQYLIEKAEAGSPLGVQHLLLAHAGVDHEADSKRKFRFLGKIADNLGPSVFSQDEIVFSEIADDLILLGVYGGQDIDHIHGSRKGGLFLPEGESASAEQRSSRD